MRAKAVSERIDVPLTTLRVWSMTFEDFLSPGARSSISERGTPTQRRYLEEDIQTLTRIKSLLVVGLTYDQVKETLAGKADTEPSALALPASVSQNGHSNGSVAVPVPIDLSELTVLLARSVTLQEETLALMREEQQYRREQVALTHQPEPPQKPLTVFARFLMRLGVKEYV